MECPNAGVPPLTKKISSLPAAKTDRRRSVTLFAPNKSFIFYIAIINLLSPLFSMAEDSNHAYVVQHTSFPAIIRESTITGIARDEHGFIWLATQRGILKFDGRSVEAYSPSDLTPKYAPGLRVSAITSDARFGIIAGFKNGAIASYIEKEDRFSRIPLPDDSYADNQIRAITVSKEGLIWLGNQTSISYLDPRSNAFSGWQPTDEHGIKVGAINNIAEASDGSVLVATDRGIFISSASSVGPIIRKIEALGDVNALVCTSGDSVWVGTSRGFVWLLSPSGEVVDRFELQNQGKTISITSLTVFEGRLVIGTDRGLFEFRSELKQPTKLFTDQPRLSNQHVSSLLASNELMWIGTYQGLNLLTESSFHVINKSRNSIANEVMALEVDVNDETWVGTYDGLFYSNRGDGTFAHIEMHTSAEDKADQRIMALALAKNVLWVGTRGNGLRYIHTDTQDFVSKKFEPFSDAAVTRLHVSRDNRGLWVGTFNYGLLHIDLMADGSVSEDISEALSTSLNEPITAILQTQDDSVIASSERNVFQIDAATLQHRKIELNFDGLDEIPTVISLHLDIKGHLFVGTLHHGIFRSIVQIEPGVVLQLFRFSGHTILANSSVYSIRKHATDNFWLSTSSGVFLLADDGRIINRFGVSDGLQGNDFNFGASHQDHKGRIYFGGSNGYNRFDPDAISTDDKPPPVVLTDLEIAGETPALNVSLQDLSEIELGYRDYYVTFVFSALDYLDPYNNLYRHKLIGFDPRWVELGNRNSATYTNLPAGEYTLHIQGASAAGIWNREGLKLQLRVLPAPWFSWWAWCIYLSLAVVALWHARKTYDNYLIRTRAIRLAEEMQIAADRAADEVQEQLDDQARLVDTIHRFNLQKLGIIGDCLSRYADRLPDDIQREFLAGHGRRVLALQQLEGSLFYRHDELLADMRAYTDALIQAILPSAAISSDKIIVINGVTENLLPGRYALPLAVILFELLANAMDHAFEDSNHSSVINVQLDRHGASEDAAEHWLLVVEDNGVSMPENISLQAPETEGFASLLAAASLVDGRVSRAPAAGTRIEVEIPLVEETVVEEGP